MIRAGLSRLRVLTLREILAHGGRTAASVIVVAVSAALLIAVIATYSSLTGSVTQLTKSIAGDADLAVTGFTDTGFDQSLVGDIETTPGVKAAVPVVQFQRSLPEPYLVLGVDFRALQLHSSLQTTLAPYLTIDSKLLSVKDGVLVGEQMGYSVGDQFIVSGQTLTAAVVIPADAAASVNGGHFVVAPLALAQRVAGREDRVDAAFVIAEPDTDLDVLTSTIADAVGHRAVVSGTGLRAAQVENALTLTRSLTLLVAAVSLVVAAFLVFNAMNMSVAQRRPTIALVRSIGAKRSVVATDVVVEAAVCGIVAGLIGIPLGLALGYWAIDRTPPFLLQIVSAPLIFVVPWIAIPITLAACVVATVIASIVAARQVYRVEPLEALLSARLQPAEQIARRTTVVAGVLGVAAMLGALAIAKFVHGLVVVGAAALFILGVLLLGVAFAKVMVATAVWLSKRMGPSGELASAAITRSPRRAWATAMTVGIAVAVGCAVFGALNDVVDSASDSLSGVRNTDLLLAGTPPASVPDVSFPAEWEGRVRATPGVATVVPGQFAHITVGDVQAQVTGLVPGNDINVAPLLDPDALRRVLAGEGVAISQPLADRFGYSVGDEISVGTPTGTHTTKVVAQFRFVSTDAGLIAMSLSDMRQWFDRPGATYLVISLEPGADVDEVKSTLRAELGDQANIFTGQQAYEATTLNIRQAGSLAVGLQWIVAVIAAIALMNTLTLAVLQRRREFGVLRAMGSTRRQISRMVLAEALAVGVVGGGIGIVGGELVHYISDIVLTTATGIDISFGANPVMLLSAAIALVLCLLGAIPPALRAARLNILAAVTVE